METTTHRDAVQDAAKRLRTAQDDLDAAVRAALADGVRQQTVAEYAGVSRQTLYSRYVKPGAPAAAAAS